LNENEVDVNQDQITIRSPELANKITRRFNEVTQENE